MKNKIHISSIDAQMVQVVAFVHKVNIKAVTKQLRAEKKTLETFQCSEPQKKRTNYCSVTLMMELQRKRSWRRRPRWEEVMVSPESSLHRLMSMKNYSSPQNDSLQEITHVRTHTHTQLCRNVESNLTVKVEKNSPQTSTM